MMKAALARISEQMREHKPRKLNKAALRRAAADAEAAAEFDEATPVDDADDRVTEPA